MAAQASRVVLRENQPGIRWTRMNLLVTAGNTQVLIDRVRCLTNIFTGRTGASIALEACGRGHRVTLLTSHPDTVKDPGGQMDGRAGQVNVRPYRTFDDLQDLMARLIPAGNLDAVVHCAAVSDYRSGGIFAPQARTRFDAATACWHADDGPPALIDRTAGKVKSDEPELWLRLVRNPKLVDRIRSDWKFPGILVKFKLEVDLSDEQLLDVAERSRRQSGADLMVANTLEGASSWTFLGPLAGAYHRVSRSELATRLLDVIELQHREAGHA
jgi:phosphopantothenoylcysteine synthetase/decarboxylase